MLEAEKGNSFSSFRRDGREAKRILVHRLLGFGLYFGQEPTGVFTKVHLSPVDHSLMSQPSNVPDILIQGLILCRCKAGSGGSLIFVLASLWSYFSIPVAYFWSLVLLTDRCPVFGLLASLLSVQHWQLTGSFLVSLLRPPVVTGSYPAMGSEYSPWDGLSRFCNWCIRVMNVMCGFFGFTFMTCSFPPIEEESAQYVKST